MVGPSPSLAGDPAIPDALLELEAVTLTAGERTLVWELSLALQQGERLVLVGPNGSGKTTLLLTLAGLRQPAAGTLRRPPSAPGMVFQDGALWPHMTVDQHLAFVAPKGPADWCEHLLDICGLTGLRDARPDRLSGGERVRLALARALAPRPSWVLLDEALAHVDPTVRAVLRDALPALLDELGAALVAVTHDPDDVLLLGRRVLCLEGDTSWWLGSAQAALESPPTPVLAAFSGRGTILTGTADQSGVVELGLGLRLESRVPGSRVRAYLDAAAVHLCEEDLKTMDAIFVASDRRGGSWVRVEGRLVRSDDPQGPARPGDPVGLRIMGQLRDLDPA